MQKLFSIGQVAQILDISTATLKRWYKWYECEDYDKPPGLKLPEYSTDNRGTKYFTIDSVAALKVFKHDLQFKYRGIMSEFNANYQWGQRGTQILINKEKKKQSKKED